MPLHLVPHCKVCMNLRREYAVIDDDMVWSGNGLRVALLNEDQLAIARMTTAANASVQARADWERRNAEHQAESHADQNE